MDPACLPTPPASLAPAEQPDEPAARGRARRAPRHRGSKFFIRSLSNQPNQCLESKLESLKAVKNENLDNCHVGDGLAGLELHAPPQKMARVESSAKGQSNT
ncbi:hypothetical protein PIB30_089591 [Stylosanthes scabra]|uniref:Uncharacterized protein n=1 Tax=Stylosanthes scabra TaxID=79078 RepID=A0ABU6WXE6_9FABA|nr:hypothetical protein [Stylosanthes scabra]